MGVEKEASQTVIEGHRIEENIRAALNQAPSQPLLKPREAQTLKFSKFLFNGPHELKHNKKEFLKLCDPVRRSQFSL
jgi:hypothetical protein